MLRALACLSPLALVACSSYGLSTRSPPPIPPFGPSPLNLAQICVLRPGWVGPLLTTPVRDNGLLVGATQAESYFCYFAETGHHEISIERGALAGPLHERIDVGPAQRYYLAFSIELDGDEAKWIGEAEARAMVKDASYTVIDHVPPDDVKPAERPISRAQDAKR